MFGRSKKKQGQQRTEVIQGAASDVMEDDFPTPRPVVVAILFESEDVSLESIEPALARQTILGKRSLAGPSAEKGEHSDSFSVEIGETVVAGMVMPAPYPAAELEFAIKTAWMWPPAVDASLVRSAASHVMLVVTGGKATAIENHLIATAVAAIIANLPGAVGVYWPGGNIVHHPEVFAAMAAQMSSPANPPLFLWVNFCVAPNPDETATLFTAGLQAIGLMEMEIHDLRESPQQLRERAVSLVAYQLQHGPVFQPGDTVGETEDAQLRVAHMPSAFGFPVTVLHLSRA